MFIASPTASDWIDDLAAPDASLEACDESHLAEGIDDEERCNGFAAFASHMAAHGWPVRVDLMRRDRDYALWQIARAHSLEDLPLRQLAARLFERLTRV